MVNGKIVVLYMDNCMYSCNEQTAEVGDVFFHSEVCVLMEFSCLYKAALLWHNTLSNPSFVLGELDVETPFMVSNMESVIGMS